MPRILIAAALALFAALPSAATDLDAMTDTERAAFRAEVRAYLLENPEVLMEAIGVLEQRRQAEATVGDQTLIQVNSEDIFNDGYSWVGGNPDGDITIVEFLDYRCGYCKQAHPEVAELVRTDGNIRYIIKEFPILGDQSVSAARFAISVKAVAGDDVYAQVHDRLMTFRGEINETSLRTLSDSLSLDTDAVMAGMNTPEVDTILGRNHELAQRMQINGTPSFVVQDQMLRGYVPTEAMAGLLEQLRG